MVKILLGINCNFATNRYTEPEVWTKMVGREAEKWFRRLFVQTSLLGAPATGTCFAIMSVKNSQGSKRKEYIPNEAIKTYARFASFAKKKERVWKIV